MSLFWTCEVGGGFKIYMKRFQVKYKEVGSELRGEIKEICQSLSHK